MSRAHGGAGAAVLVGVVAAMSVTVVCSCSWRFCWRDVGSRLARRACGWPVWAWVACVFLALRAAIGVLWVRGFLPPLFLLLPVVFLDCWAKGGGVGRVFSFFFLCEGRGLLWLLGGM